MNDTDHLDRFTEQAREVLNLAKEEALHFQHDYIGSEHLLLGLIREDHGIAAKVLKSMGAELPRARNTVDILIGRGEHTTSHDVSLTQRSRELLHIAAEKAQCLGHNFIGTEHLLLALVHEDLGIAASILGSLGIQSEMIRTKTMQEINK